MEIRKLITGILLLLSIAMYGQDTIYLNQYGEKIKNIQLAKSYKIVNPDSTIAKDGKIEREYYLSGKLKSVTHLINVLNEKTNKKEYVKEGKYQMWYEGGQIRREIDYHNNLYDGNLITYWENKQLKRQDLYKAGKLIDGKCFTIEGYKEGDYFPYERKPEFPGGENNLISFVSRNLRYARDAQEARIQGKVIMTFVIDTVGQVTDIMMKKSLYPSLDMEAYRVISIMPKWKPCMIDGEIIKWKFTFPIGYRLE